MKRLKKKTNKQSKRRAAESPPDCNINDSSVPLDLDAELSSLLAKNKLLPSDDSSQIILANTKTTPYTAAKHDKKIMSFPHYITLPQKGKSHPNTSYLPVRTPHLHTWY